MRYFIEVSYKGTNYHGWQRQPNGITIQEELEKALGIIMRRPIEIIGSSRTDAGVHAEQQFAHFDVEEAITSSDRLVLGLNSLLPKDIAVPKIVAVRSDIHSRFAATYRCYEYRIVFQKNAFLSDLAHVFRPALNIRKMNEAAELLLQYTDFECFSKIHTDVKTFLCTIEYAYWKETLYGLTFYIKANRFLRGMVRAIVGTLLEIGQGKKTYADFEQLIISKNRKNAAAQAPACGLFLVEVGYDWESIIVEA
ncbi:tRNA pseudouridine(38-40) synthase TruA [Runella sp.]|uniref:tRNA pseudouridine(38-40) synthase TruA n=1 Tax=Runella sp. TaxID=1960881 RepID=UPI003D13B8A2